MADGLTLISPLWSRQKAAAWIGRSKMRSDALRMKVPAFRYVLRGQWVGNCEIADAGVAEATKSPSEMSRLLASPI